MKYTPEQTKENRQQLSEALRSGKYQQNQLSLTNKNYTAFCCLGVACEISGFNQWQFKKGDRQPSFNGERLQLPNNVRAWLGFRTSIGELDNGEYKSLAEMNDMGITFPEIASMIDSEPEGLIAI